MSVKVQDLTKEYHDHRKGVVRAVNGVNFNCEEGEVFGLLGPNGAGKTSTLRIISTILKPSHGSVTVAGYNVVERPEQVRRNLGFLSNDTKLYPRLTPREVVRLFGRLYDIRRDKLEKRISELMELLDMKEFADVWCEKLSTGTQQKACIARAVIHDPPVIILDEPSSGLDVPTVRTVHNFIREYRNRGKCIVFSTHVMSEAQKICDRIAVINRGKITATGAFSDLQKETGLEDPEDLFIALTQRGS
jgi:sodium transport system ATP-binding protein